jgi:hypothetical protein
MDVVQNESSTHNCVEDGEHVTGTGEKRLPSRVAGGETSLPVRVELIDRIQVHSDGSKLEQIRQCKDLQHCLHWLHLEATYLDKTKRGFEADAHHVQWRKDKYECQ